MLKRHIDAIVRFLGSRSKHDSLAGLSAASRRDCQRLMDWLDASGLPLYFLHKLRAERATDAIPGEVLVQLDERQRQNASRIARMRKEFDRLNHALAMADVRFAALKGFSLVPEFCPDATLRPQSDLDYLVAPDSLEVACRVLTDSGYVLRRQTGDEFAFWIPSPNPVNQRAQYDPEAPFMIELHRAIWNHDVAEIPGTQRSIRYEQIEARRCGESRFPALPESEIFLGQVLHAFRHLVLDEVRLSWLLELGSFVARRREQHRFWEQLSVLLESNPMTAEIVGIVTGLAAEVFSQTEFAVPSQFRRTTALTEQWLKAYGREVVLASCPAYGIRLFPKSKLLLFLMEQFSSRGGHHLRRRSLLPVRGLRRLAKPPKKSSSLPFGGAAEKTSWFVSRLFYHLGADLRYLVEIPRWRRITRQLPAGPRQVLEAV